MNLNKLSIQEILSLGYIYLLLLGVITETIFYSFFDLHIIAHSDILDILLTPVSILTDNFVIPIFTIVGCVILYLIRLKITPKLHKKNRVKESYQKKHNIEKLDKILSRKPTFTEMVPVYALVIFSMFIGIKIGGGFKLSQRMKDKDLNYLDVINFQNNDVINATIIGQNSSYFFYVKEGETTLTTAPITQNIKKITKREKP